MLEYLRFKIALGYHDKAVKAFTLAEVLITLTIIGVIAAITIPALIQDIQDAQFKTAFKKEYSVFSQAFTEMRTDNGGTLAGAFANNSGSFYNQFKKYMNVVSYSATSRTSANVNWHDNCFFKYLNGNTASSNFTCSGCPSATFADGSFFMINLGWADDFASCTRATNPKDGLCFNVELDVNGRQPPNIMGKDIYVLSVYRDKTVPDDWDYTGAVDASSCTSSGTGAGCAVKYMMQ